MRIGLASVLVVGILLAWLAPIPVAEALLGTAASTTLGGTTTATVEADPPFALLGGRAARVRLSGRTVGLPDGRIRAATIDVTLVEVDLLARRAARVEGSLAGVTAGTEGVAIERIDLSGPSDALETALTIGREEALELIRAGLASGVPVEAAELVAPGRIRATVGGTELVAALLVRKGSLVAVPKGVAVAPITLIRASSVAPLVLRSVVVTADGLVIRGTVGLDALGL